MVAEALEVADILSNHGPAWREANRGPMSLDQSKVTSAIELSGGHAEIAHNSCHMGKG